MSIANYDQQIEKMYHPENFEDEVSENIDPKIQVWFNKGLKKQLIINKRRKT